MNSVSVSHIKIIISFFNTYHVNHQYSLNRLSK